MVPAGRWAGPATAQNNLAAMYAYGRGVPQDDAEAVRWYAIRHYGLPGSVFSGSFLCMIISFIMRKQPPLKPLPGQAIMPDRSLTYSRAGASPMPAQPAWFHRLDEILSALPRTADHGGTLAFFQTNGRWMSGNRARSATSIWTTTSTSSFSDSTDAAHAAAASCSIALFSRPWRSNRHPTARSSPTGMLKRCEPNHKILGLPE